MTTDLVPCDISFEEMYDEYYNMLLAYLVRLVRDREAAEDLCQESFIKALRNWHTRDPYANTVAWLYRIATNTAYDYLRRQKRIHFTSLTQPDSLMSPISIEAQVGDAALIEDALAQIPPHERLPIIMHAYRGHSMHEIAETIGCTKTAVKMRLFRARRRFRAAYQYTR